MEAPQRIVAARHRPRLSEGTLTVKRALSEIDGRDVEATEYAAKDEAWQNTRRHGLKCLGCGEPAFFRTPTDARRPSFGARHNSTCAVTIVKPWSAFRFLQ